MCSSLGGTAWLGRDVRRALSPREQKPNSALPTAPSCWAGEGPGPASARGADTGRLSRIWRSGGPCRMRAFACRSSRRSRPQSPANEWAPRPVAATRWRCPPLSARTAPSGLRLGAAVLGGDVLPRALSGWPSLSESAQPRVPPGNCSLAFDLLMYFDI